MPVDPLTAGLNLGKLLIEKIWPDPAQQAEQIFKLEQLYQQGDLAQLTAHVELMKGQLEVNKAEASHKSIFVAGWRPFIGWVGGFALAYQFILYPLLMWVWAILAAKGLIPADVEAPPVLDTGALFAIITGMLGVGAMRSFDKRGKVQTDAIKSPRSKNPR